MNSVNAAIITYNHVGFVDKAIQRAVAQKFEGEYKIILHDDCSSDGTTDACKRWKDKHPDLIELHTCSKNKGMGLSWKDTLAACKADYIAICEGDDYWMDPLKLQKQVSFLEGNREYSISCHRIYKKKESGRPLLYEDEFATNNEVEYDINDMATYGNLVATPSVVFRNKLMPALPAGFEQLPIVDYVLHLLNARYGKIKYFPEAMAVYREHARGAWGGQSLKVNAANMTTSLEFLLSQDFPQEVKAGLQKQLKLYRVTWLNELMQEDWDAFITAFESLRKQDEDIAIALIERMKKERDAYRESRTFRTIQKLRNITKK
jgi:glycosyltransferase involved in cell wall biosynthesis